VELLLRALLQGRRHAMAHDPRPAGIRRHFHGGELLRRARWLIALQTSSAQLFDRAIRDRNSRLHLGAQALACASIPQRESEYFADIPKLDLPEELLRLAEHIIKTKTADFHTAWLEDRYRTALVSMLRERKRAELPTKAAAAKPSQRNVINLMDVARIDAAGSEG
jgi:hypothetical protein